MFINTQLRFQDSHVDMIHHLRFILKFENVCINETKNSETSK